jgi:nicotinate-nucleotide pyrophosphorylase (carboxylating)
MPHRQALMTDVKVPIFSTTQSAYQKAMTRAVRDALREDLGTGDLTTAALKLKGKRGEALLLAKADGVLAGADVFAACFKSLDPRAKLKWSCRDGDAVTAKMAIVTVSGDAAAILSAERSALNFISHLSGIATATAKMVALIPPGGARLLDTRKTTPGLRLLEKRATVLGGAVNHRIGLYDALMLKDNHIAAMGDLEQALPLALRARGKRHLICETTNLDQVRLALNQGATWLLLDNFELRDLGLAVHHIREWENSHGREIIIEASGGITPGNIAAVAGVGVDFISSGHITHSATSLDFSLEWVGPPARAKKRLP